MEQHLAVVIGHARARQLRGKHSQQQSTADPQRDAEPLKPGNIGRRGSPGQGGTQDDEHQGRQHAENQGTAIRFEPDFPHRRGRDFDEFDFGAG